MARKLWFMMVLLGVAISPLQSGEKSWAAPLRLPWIPLVLPVPMDWEVPAAEPQPDPVPNVSAFA